MTSPNLTICSLLSCTGSVATEADEVTGVDGDDTTSSRGRYLSLVFPKFTTLTGVVLEELVGVVGMAEVLSLALEDTVLPGVVSAVDEVVGLCELAGNGFPRLAC